MRDQIAPLVRGMQARDQTGQLFHDNGMFVNILRMSLVKATYIYLV